MRVIIAGSRSLSSDGKASMSFPRPGAPLIERAVHESGFVISHVLSGGADGIDTAAITWAIHHEIPYTICPANWVRDGRRAGLYRNSAMVMQAEALISIWDGVSRGTAHCMAVAAAAGLKTHCIRVPADWV